MALGRFFSSLRFTTLKQSLGSAFARFPLPFAASLMLTAVSLMGLFTRASGDGLLFVVGLFCTLFMLFGMVSGLYAEGQNLPRTKRIAADGVACVLAAVLTFTVGRDVGLSHGLIVMAGILSLTFAAHTLRRSSEDSVWFFNYLNIVTVATAGLSVLVIGLGASAIIGTIDYLFGVKLPGELYGTVWITAMCFFFPVFILAHIPRQFDWPSEACATPFGIGFIANYLLVPLMLLYTVVLYAYFARIVVLMELPRGNLGLLVAAFGVVGVLTHLACHAMQRDGIATLKFFYRHFYKLMTLPIILMAIGLWTRISDYGVTPERYLAVSCLLWLAVLSTWHVARPQTMHIKYIPMLAAALLLIAAAGPWGAEAVSIRSQVHQLKAALMQTKILTDGRVQKAAANSIDFKTRQRISSMVDFLQEHKALDRLKDIGATTAEDLKKSREGGCDDSGFMSDCGRDMSEQELIMARWGLVYVPRWEQDRAPAEDNKFSLDINAPYADSNTLERIAPYDYAADLYVYRHQSTTGTTLKSKDGTVLAAHFGPHAEIILQMPNVPPDLIIDIGKNVAELAKLQQRRLPTEAAARLVFKAENKALAAELRIQSVSGQIEKDGKITLENLRGRLLLRKKS